MARDLLLAAALLGGVCAVSACTQPDPLAPANAPPRNAYLGDPGAKLAPASPAARNTNLDRPAPSSTNGNQPDRAAAGGGAH